MSEDELFDDLPLAPPVDRSAAEVRRALEPVELPEPTEEPSDEPSWQFTVRDLLLITFMSAVGFAVLRLTPPAAFAGAMGGVAILGLALLTIVKPQRAIFHLVWWTVLGVYVVASVIAVVTK